MALDVTSLFTPATQQQWLQTLLNLGQQVGLTTTAWQPGGVTRTILVITSYALAAADTIVSTMNQGGFLDNAALVTPDPSVTPGVAPGWLDILSDGSYNNQRIQPQFATCSMAFTNTGSSAGPYQPGTFHVLNPSTNKTYSNLSTFTIAAQTLVGSGVTGATNASPIVITTSAAHGRATGDVVTIAGVGGNTAANGTWTLTVVDATHFSLNGSNGLSSGAYTSGGTVNLCTTASFQADAQGAASSAAIGAITSLVTAIVGVSCTNTTAATGTNAESNSALVTRDRNKLQSLSPNGAKGAYAYVATSATLAPYSLSLKGGPITRVTVAVNPNTGAVTVTLANASGAPAGVSGSGQITGATNASPIVIQTSGAHGLSTGDLAVIYGVNGNTAANCTLATPWTITVVDATHFSLNGSTGNGAYTSGGNLEGSDLGLVDALIQANADPNAVTVVTQAATTLSVTVAATVWVPAAQKSAVVSAVQNALTNYFASVPIGGFTTGVPTPNTMPFDAVLGAVQNAAPYIQDSTLTLNGGTADIALTSTQVPVISGTPTITVNTF
jgi:hypothetical protein